MAKRGRKPKNVRDLSERSIKDKKKKIIEIYKRNALNISKTCRQAIICRATFYNWRQNDKDFDNDLKDIEESYIDDLETNLRVLAKGLPKLDEKGRFIGWIEKPNLKAIEILLRVKAVNRGYGLVPTEEIQREEKLIEKTEEELFEEIDRLRQNMKTYNG